MGYTRVVWRYVPNGAVMTKPKPQPFTFERAGKFGGERELRCSFCWKPRIAIRHLVGGPGEGANQIFICDECIALCAKIISEEEDEG
jgi:hypothetical protein